MINSKVIDVVLSVELNRGDSETQFSKAIRSIKQIYGVKRLVEILCALGDMPLDRNTYYSYMKVVGKKECLCHLLRVCEPYKEDNVNIFAELVKKNKISQDRLVQVAMYAPQWMPMIEEYLECDGFASGCYYFMAHMNEYFDEKTEAMIAKYTPLTREELNDGAFDLKWFFEAYNRLGEKMFDKLYKSAKYISDGSKHTRARKYAMAALGKVDKKELEREITDKRNKDLLMSYALIPIEGKDDVQGRYEFVQKFLKESKQFGAQRRASESKAVEMTIKNLSCLAGYEDELRLTLAMEADMAAKNNKFFDGITIDEYHIMIVVDVLGKASVQIEKDGKKLKSIPAQLKKVQEFLEIKEFEKKLKEQYKRCVAMFERAMEDSICYQVKELKGLFINPVTRSILERLVFIVSDKDNKKNGSLCLLADFDVEAEKEKITGNSGDTMVRIAHPVDFYRSGEWGRWQKYFFELNKEQDIKQPFKQVFREYYPKLEEELGTEFTRQFAGYQISVQRTIAALKTRGWVADYENGLQKVYYKDNIVAVIYALADWFSPADTEAPTIEYVKFFDRKTFEPKILEDVPDIIFSEVCRDTDLAVSLANVGGVEPETTHSTIEMRTVIAKFNLELFGISNVTFDKSHAFIKGKYAEYSIHLGSGVIHIVGGRMVSVLPVHTQKRGKIFLPFIDDDPKTAEIMTKILIFAKDNKIKDPYIMEQILGS